MKYILRKDVLQIVADWIVSNIESILIRATPILSPLPSAFAIIHALGRAGWSHPELLGGIIEAMGLCAGALMGALAMFNTRHPTRKIPPWIGQGLFGFYVLLAVMIIGGYETLPVTVAWANGSATAGEVVKSFVPLLFPGLTLIGSVIVALREYMQRSDEEVKHQTQRTELAQDARRQREDAEFNLELDIKRREAEQRLALVRADHAQRLELERLKLETKLSTVNRKPVAKPVNQGEQPHEDKAVDSDKVDKALGIYRDKPRASLRFVGNQIGMTHTGVSKMLDRLESQNVIHRNGNGVEILA